MILTVQKKLVWGQTNNNAKTTNQSVLCTVLKYSKLCLTRYT